MTEPAEDRLRRLAAEMYDIADQLDAMPCLPQSRVQPLLRVVVVAADATQVLAEAVVAAAHRVPGPEDV